MKRSISKLTLILSLFLSFAGFSQVATKVPQDTTNARLLRLVNKAEGTQSITVTGGTVVATPTGTQAITGTVTATPTGTANVNITGGTVTATPSGTQNVSVLSGSIYVTNVKPSIDTTNQNFRTANTTLGTIATKVANSNTNETSMMASLNSLLGNLTNNTAGLAWTIIEGANGTALQ